MPLTKSDFEKKVHLYNGDENGDGTGGYEDFLLTGKVTYDYNYGDHREYKATPIEFVRELEKQGFITGFIQTDTSIGADIIVTYYGDDPDNDYDTLEDYMGNFEDDDWEKFLGGIEYEKYMQANKALLSFLAE